MWSMNVSGRIEKRQSWGGSWDPKWSQRLPALIALPIRGSTCVGGERIVKKKIGRPRKVGRSTTLRNPRERFDVDGQLGVG
jgi:hypothetical protein